jgi:hypothetical protein
MMASGNAARQAGHKGATDRILLPTLGGNFRGVYFQSQNERATELVQHKRTRSADRRASRERRC